MWSLFAKVVRKKVHGFYATMCGAKMPLLVGISVPVVNAAIPLLLLLLLMMMMMIMMKLITI